jgi:hypothetical protein
MTAPELESSKKMSDVSMLTLLIKAAATIKNQSGDYSLHGYVEMQESPYITKDPNFVVLDCLNDILVQDTQVLASSYDDASSFTLVMPSSDLDSDLNDSEPHSNPFDMECPPHESVGFATALKSMNAAVVPNPNNNEASGQSSEPLGEIQEVGGGQSLWNIEDPLYNAVK